MLRHRVIPVVLLDGYSVLKTIGFDVRRNLGNPITVAKIYNSRNVDELIILDIDASKENRHIDYFTIQDVASECFMPLSVGGGLKSCQEIEKALKSGADKVILNTNALKTPHLIKEASKNFGSQCIVISVDVKISKNQYQIYSHAGLITDKKFLAWIVEVEQLGAGELFLNNVDLDGKMTGYDSELVKLVSGKINIPLISCGGAGKPSDCTEIVKSGASAAAAASIFHFTDFTPEHCRRDIKLHNLPTR